MFDIETWKQWKYKDNLCVGCENKTETMDHFMQCLSLGETNKIQDWEIIYSNDTYQQYEIAKEIKRRKDTRENILKTNIGHQRGGSRAPGLNL